MNKTILICLICCFAAGTTAAQPRLKVVEGRKIDLGRVDQGKIATGRLTLKNTGNQKLILGDIEASCGCTGSALSKKELQPGDTATLFIAFTSGTLTGPIHKALTIKSNAADAPQKSIDIAATVVVDLSFSPPWFHFKNAEAGRQNTSVVTVKNESRKSLKITGFRTQLSHFALTYPRKPFGPGSTVDLTAVFTPESAKPVLGDSVFVMTTSRIQPALCIRVFTTARKTR